MRQSVLTESQAGFLREEKEALLAQYYPAAAQDEAFRHGFTRGEYYYAALVERGDPRRSSTFAAMDVAS